LWTKRKWNFRDVGAAQEEAAQAMADMARDAIRGNTGELTERMAVEARDDAGPVLHVKFFFEIERKN
jgi:hypothetical protein